MKNYDVIFEKNTCTNVQAYDKKDAVKRAEKALKINGIKDKFVRLRGSFQGEFYTNRY